MGNRMEKIESSGKFYFGELQNPCGWWLQPWNSRCLLLGRKAKTNLDSKLKNRDITLPVKFHIVKAMVFPIVIYGCVSWTMKKAECQRIDTFELCRKKMLESPMDSKEIKPVNPKGNQPWIFIGRLFLKVSFQYSWWEELTLWKRPWCWERWKAKEVSSRGWDG